ncbi:MAG: Ig-like domain repeat protein [Chloroflexi bacterium]|nr:Ig-like domain repeat protein [Chloroflexota bacterium]
MDCRLSTRNSRPLVLRTVALLAGLVLGLVPWVAHAQSQEPVKMRIEITENGFNGQPDFNLELEQGKTVELTFVFVQKAALEDVHIVVLKGYGLETPEISYYNKEATLKFVADKPGTFELTCDLDCEIHDKLKRAHLKVKGSGAASGAGAAALVPTAISMYPSAWEVAGAPVKLSASLKDANGSPVAKATVRFLVDTEFAGTKGQMEIGAARTDANGAAAVSYKPTFPGTQQITAHFEGMGLFAESEQSLRLQVREAEPAYVVAPRGLEGVSDRIPIGVAVVLLSIWSTFTFVLYQVFRISRATPARG